MTPTPASGFEALKPHTHEAAELMRLLANGSRLQLLCQLADGEHSVGELERTLDIRQPALSQRLAELRKAGIVTTRREARSVFYSLENGRVRAVLEVLRSLHCDGAVPAPAPGAAARSGTDAPTPYPTGDAARFARLAR